MLKHPRRRFGAVAMSAALVTAVAACGGGGGSDESDGGGGSGDAAGLIVGTTDTVDTVDPAKCYSFFCGNILQNTTQTLIDYKPGTTDYEPRLASSLPKISEDGKTYTFPLRKGVTFHDGSKMTSEDVKFSLNRARWMNHPEGAGFLLNDIKSIDTPDDYTVVIHLKQPDITFTSKLAYTVATIVPSDSYTSPDHELKDGKGAEKYVNEKLIGTGPYEIADFREGESITLKAYDGYWGDKPPSENVQIRFYQKSSQLLTALKADEVDIAFRALTPEQRESLQGDDDFKVVKGPGASIRYLVINNLIKPMDDPKVRKAVAAAIDRDRIVKDVLGGAGQPLYSMIPPTFEANEPVFKKAYAGKDPSDFLGDRKVDITLWYSTNHYGPTEQALAESVKRQLNESGSFNVKTEPAPWAQFTEDAYPGKSGQYPMFLLGWYPDYLDPDDYIAPFYGCDSFLQMYCNDRMEKLIRKERTAGAPDSPQRMKTFGKIQQLSAQDAPLIPLFVLQPFAFTASNVQGVKDTMGPEQIFRYYMISETS